MMLILNNIKLQLGDTNFAYNTNITNSIIGIYGLSGAGKSVLLNIICGIEKPKSGLIEFNGLQLYNSEKGINLSIHKRNIGVVFQDNYLFPHLNVKQNLLYSKTYNKGKDKYISLENIIDLLQIKHLLKNKPSQLSGGEKQRVAIGRTLLSQPKLLLFDEPFSNLDRQKRKEIISYLLQINNRYNIPLLIVSHDLEDILRLTNELLIIDKQKIIASGNYVEISESGIAPNIISHKRYLNVFDAQLIDYNSNHKLFRFANTASSKHFIYTNSNLLNTKNSNNKMVRLCISPDDIALSTNALEGTSIQNQLLGRIIKLFENEGSVFVTIDCGFNLVAEISTAAFKQLKLKINQEIYCLIKAKAVEVIHEFRAFKDIVSTE